MPPKTKTLRATRSTKSKVSQDSSSSSDDDAKVINVESASDSGSDSEVQVDPEPVRKNIKKAAPSKKETVELKTSKTSKKSDENPKKSEKNKKSAQSDEEQDVYADDQNDRQQRPRRENTSILNFKYEDYYELDDAINTLNLTEILRYCTAIASKEGKIALMKTLRNTLQATNSEKSFPDFNVNRPQQQYNNGGGSWNNGQSFGSRAPPPRRPNSNRNDQEYRNFE